MASLGVAYPGPFAAQHAAPPPFAFAGAGAATSTAAPAICDLRSLPAGRPWLAGGKCGGMRGRNAESSALTHRREGPKKSRLVFLLLCVRDSGSCGNGGVAKGG
jgi:hypothetical protein